MVYANQTDYVEYLEGTQPFVPLNLFDKYARIASKVIDNETHNRLNNVNVYESFKECVKTVCIELAEELYKTTDVTYLKQFNVKSVTVGNYSKSIDTSIVPSDIGMKDLILDGLDYCNGKPTNLRYRGLFSCVETRCCDNDRC